MLDVNDRKCSNLPSHDTCTSSEKETAVDTAATRTSVDVELRPFDSDQIQHNLSGITSSYLKFFS